MKRLQSQSRKILRELLQARLVAHRGMRIRAPRGRFGRILTTLAMHLVLMLGLHVIRLQVIVRDRPRRRYAAMMVDLAEVLLAQPEEGGAVELGVAANIIVGVGVKILAFPVLPHFFGVV